LSLINFLIEQGFDIVIITQFDGYEKKLKNIGCHVYNLFISRKGINPFVDIITLIQLFFQLLYLRPFCCLTFTIKPVIYVSLALRILNISNIAMITGLGTGFIRGGWLTLLVKKLYRFALAKVSYVFFQNPSDQQLFFDQNLVCPCKCKLTPGSGIDLQKYVFSEKNNDSNTFIFLLIARLVWDKGIKEYLKAARQLHEEFPEVQFHIIGPSGVQNRTAIPSSEIENWKLEGVINYLGEVENVQQEIAEATCIVLPSYREGTSRVLLEASAIGRPIVATAVPGCKEVVIDEKSGFLCKVKDSHDLYLKMKKMYLLDQDKRNEMGLIGRKHVENKFNHELVCQIYLDTLSDL
jgi:glycosyltransferase involved in cell wall biosynthesis